MSNDELNAALEVLARYAKILEENNPPKQPDAMSDEKKAELVRRALLKLSGDE